MDSKENLSLGGFKATVQQGMNSNINLEPGTSSSFMVQPGTSSGVIVEPETNSDAVLEATGRASPDTNCSICLGALVNKSFTDTCMHIFCFTCLKEWSKVKAQCPLCKQSFSSIYYNMNSVDYQQYVLPPRPPPPPPRGRLDDEPMVSIFFGLDGGSLSPRQDEPLNFHVPISTAHWLSRPNSRHFIFRRGMWSRRQRDINGRNQDFTATEIRAQRRDNVSNTHSLPRATDSRHSELRPNRSSNFRRRIYRLDMWIQPQADVTGRVREATPEFFRLNPAMVHRLVPWLNRELNVLVGVVAREVISLVLRLIVQVPIRSQEFSTQLSRYTGRNTEHFVHEFYTFATTPFDFIGYDTEAVYVKKEDLAHTRTNLHTSSDEDVQEVATTATATVINIASDSDECVIIENVEPQQSHRMEVITLDSEDDVEETVSTSTSCVPPSTTSSVPPSTTSCVTPTTASSVTTSRPGPVVTTSRPSETVQSTTKHRVLTFTTSTDAHEINVSINIDLPPSSNSNSNDNSNNVESRQSSRSSRRSNHRHRCPSLHVDSSSDSGASHRCKRSSKKLLKKKTKLGKKSVKSSSRSEEPVVSIKREIKTEIQDVTNLPSTSFHKLPKVKREKKYNVKKYFFPDPENSDSSD